MARFQDAWLTHQQQRFMRPDAARYVVSHPDRYMREDAFRWMPPGCVNGVQRKFDPDQPRVPAGSPEGGQWAGDGESGNSEHGEGVVEEILSDVAEVAKDGLEKLFDLVLGRPEETECSSELPSDDGELTLIANRGPKHHWVARQVFEKYPFSKDTLNVFENAVTAPLNDPTSNYYDTMHRQYNMGVDDAMKQFLNRNGIRADQMTPDQARQFVGEVRRSTDPRIFDFNKRLLMREFNYLTRRMPRTDS